MFSYLFSSIAWNKLPWPESTLTTAAVLYEGRYRPLTVFHTTTGWVFETQMADFAWSITLRVIHGSQETVLTAAESRKSTRKAGLTSFIFYGITWWERRYMREAKDCRQQYVQCLLCVSAEAIYFYICLWVPACMCFSVKAEDNWQTVTQIRGKGLEEWSQTGISRKWRLAKQEQRDCINTSAVPLFSRTLALLSGSYFSQRTSHVLCVCVSLVATETFRGLQWLQGLLCAALWPRGTMLISWNNNMPQTILMRRGDVIERWLQAQTGKHRKH